MQLDGSADKTVCRAFGPTHSKPPCSPVRAVRGMGAWHNPCTYLMNDEVPEKTPRLPRGVRLHECAVRKCWFLQAPERAVRLDQPAISILKIVDGVRSVSDIVSELSKEFSAPVEQIEKDVRAFLNDLARRHMIELVS